MKDNHKNKEPLLSILEDASKLINTLEDPVSKRKKIEDTLHECEERYRIFFSLANDVMFSFDRQLKILSISPNIERVLGYKPEELIGRSFLDCNLLHPEDLKEAIENSVHVIAGGTLLSTIFKFITKEGIEILGELSAFPLKRDEHVVEVINVARDITRSVVIEKSIKESVEKYQTILQGMPYAVSIIRLADKRYLYANEAFSKITGYSIEETIGNTPFNLKLPATPEDNEICIDIIKNKNLIDNQRFQYRKKNGARLMTVITARPIHYGGEECVGIFSEYITSLE
ncbi:MAG: PAS domain-containing protein [Desulfomonilia bacterium]